MIIRPRFLNWTSFCSSRCVPIKGVTGDRLPGGVDVEQLLGEVGHGPADPLLGPGPLLCAQPRQRRRVFARSDITADPSDLVTRHIKLVALGVMELQILTL